MVSFARIAVNVVAGAGLCAAAAALSPHAAATPLKTGGYKCLETAPGAAPCSAAAIEAAGVVAPPLGPPIPVLPAAIIPPVPAAPPVPVVPPAPAAPMVPMGGVASGKGVPTTGPANPGGPEDGVPIEPGPQG